MLNIDNAIPVLYCVVLLGYHTFFLLLALIVFSLLLLLQYIYNYDELLLEIKTMIAADTLFKTSTFKTSNYAFWYNYNIKC
jgi:predicted membrane protein